MNWSSDREFGSRATVKPYFGVTLHQPFFDDNEEGRGLTLANEAWHHAVSYRDFGGQVDSRSLALGRVKKYQGGFNILMDNHTNFNLGLGLGGW